MIWSNPKSTRKETKISRYLISFFFLIIFRFSKESTHSIKKAKREKVLMGIVDRYRAPNSLAFARFISREIKKNRIPSRSSCLSLDISLCGFQTVTTFHPTPPTSSIFFGGDHIPIVLFPSVAPLTIH